MTAYATINHTRTETRTAFCPVCLVRLQADAWSQANLEWSPTCGARACRQGSEALWMPLAPPRSLSGECNPIQAAQDALLAAKEPRP